MALRLGSMGERMVMLKGMGDIEKWGKTQVITKIELSADELDAAVQGGEFVDRATGAAYAPSHNSLVAFRVPRLHEVRPPTSDRLRYSVFGWLYAPAGGAPRGGGGGAAPRKKRKRKRGKAPS